MERYRLNLAGLHCGACVARVREALAGLPGVTDVRVTLEPQAGFVQADQPLSEEAFGRAVTSAGDYRVASVVATNEWPEAGTPPPSSPLVDLQLSEAHDAPKDNVSKQDARKRDGQTGVMGDTSTRRWGEWLTTYYPLLLVVAYIAGGTVILAYRTGAAVPPEGWSLMGMMADGMGLFFVGFAFFKLLDIRGFSDAYRMYDLLAKPFPVWGWIYPFVELGLGIVYLLRVGLIAAHLVTLVVMVIGTLGVIGALRQRQEIRCACLGTGFNLPMSTVTLIEDGTMALMAAAMIGMEFWPMA